MQTVEQLIELFFMDVCNAKVIQFNNHLATTDFAKGEEEIGFHDGSFRFVCLKKSDIRTVFHVSVGEWKITTRTNQELYICCFDIIPSGSLQCVHTLLSKKDC